MTTARFGIRDEKGTLQEEPVAWTLATSGFLTISRRVVPVNFGYLLGRASAQSFESLPVSSPKHLFRIVV
jgi:hypothetical protein